MMQFIPLYFLQSLVKCHLDDITNSRESNKKLKCLNCSFDTVTYSKEMEQKIESVQFDTYLFDSEPIKR